MKGIHHIIAHDQLVLYEFDVKRNITIIRGDSATGKTTLYNIIRSFNTQKSDEPGLVYVDCDKPCIALGEQNLEVNLRNTSDSIVFLDEESIAGCDARELSKIMRESDNYYVIITRDTLSWLPCSITEIYRIKGSDAYPKMYRAYNQLDRIYKSDRESNKQINCDVIITEDSGSGREMFERAFPDCKVESAYGKSNILEKIKEHKDDNAIAIVDGAAFGAEMGAVIKCIRNQGSGLIYAPESFEYLLLNLRMFRETKKKLENTADYAESSEYFSWEQYYTELLHEELERFGIRYSKGKMPKQLINDKTLAEFRSILPDIFK